MNLRYKYSTQTVSLHVASTESLGGCGVHYKLHAFCILIQQLHSEVHIMKWS